MDYLQYVLFDGQPDYVSVKNTCHNGYIGMDSLQCVASGALSELLS